MKPIKRLLSLFVIFLVVCSCVNTDMAAITSSLKSDFDTIREGFDSVTSQISSEEKNNFSLTSKQLRDAYKGQSVFQRFSKRENTVYNPREKRSAERLQAQLNSVVKKYEGRSRLSISEQEEIWQATIPFLNYLAYAKADRDNGVAILPSEKVKLKYPAYCMDSTKPAPKKGERFQIRSASTLIPKELIPVYEGLMQHTSQKKRAHSSVSQGIVWGFRNAIAADKPIDFNKFSSKQRKIITESYPEVAESIRQYNRKKQRSKLLKNLVDKVGIGEQLKQVNKIVQTVGSLADGVQSGVPSISNVENISNTLAELERMPVEGKIGDPITAYSLIGDNVAIYADNHRGGAKSVGFEIANSGKIPLVFEPSKYTAHSTRGVQRLAIQSHEIGGGGEIPAGLQFLSLGGDMLPVVGSLKSAIQLLTGKDLITGEEVNRAEELLGILPYGKIIARGGNLGNPFKDKSAAEIDSMFINKGFTRRGPDPQGGTGGYVNPRTGRSYHLDPKEWGKHREPNHVDINRPKSYNGSLGKKKLPYKE